MQRPEKKIASVASGAEWPELAESAIKKLSEV
jgi:hypothetical protein